MNHQISDTFATVQQSDRSWTEKVCLSVGANDGSLQLGFGLGKYLNRNVMDAYAGVSRGVEQWTVRSSRQLMPAPDAYSVGPIHYDVLDNFMEFKVEPSNYFQSGRGIKSRYGLMFFPCTWHPPELG